MTGIKSLHYKNTNYISGSMTFLSKFAEKAPPNIGMHLHNIHFRKLIRPQRTYSKSSQFTVLDFLRKVCEIQQFKGKTWRKHATNC